MLHCNIAGAHHMALPGDSPVSKQLSISATFAVLAKAAFALSAAPLPSRLNETGAPAFAAAPAFKVLLPGS
jgi:hypothetical protein